MFIKSIKLNVFEANRPRDVRFRETIELMKPGEMVTFDTALKWAEKAYKGYLLLHNTTQENMAGYAQFITADGIGIEHSGLIRF